MNRRKTDDASCWSSITRLEDEQSLLTSRLIFSTDFAHDVRTSTTDRLAAYSNPLTTASADSISDAALVARAYESQRQKILSFFDLADSWNGYDARKPNDYAIVGALRLLETLYRAGYTPYYSFPTVDGDIVVEVIRSAESYRYRVVDTVFISEFQLRGHEVNASKQMTLPIVHAVDLTPLFYRDIKK